jgi:hypothetical protein
MRPLRRLEISLVVFTMGSFFVLIGTAYLSARIAGRAISFQVQADVTVHDFQELFHKEKRHQAGSATFST